MYWGLAQSGRADCGEVGWEWSVQARVFNEIQIKTLYTNIISSPWHRAPHAWPLKCVVRALPRRVAPLASNPVV